MHEVFTANLAALTSRVGFISSAERLRNRSLNCPRSDLVNATAMSGGHLFNSTCLLFSSNNEKTIPLHILRSTNHYINEVDMHLVAIFVLLLYTRIYLFHLTDLPSSELVGSSRS